MRALIVLLVACSAPRPSEVPSNTAPPSPTKPACPSDGTARLTILTGQLPAGCEGGVFTIDAEVRGKYPVSCAEVPAGLHTVGIESANDCAGYMKCKLELVPGENVLDLRAPACQ